MVRSCRIRRGVVQAKNLVGATPGLRRWPSITTVRVAHVRDPGVEEFPVGIVVRVGGAQRPVTGLSSANNDQAMCEALRSIPPVTWTPACVSDRDDINVLVANSVDDAVRKSVNVELAARWASAMLRTNFWVRLNEFDRRGYGVEQLSAEMDTTVLVPSNCCGQLRRGRIAELDRLHRPRMSFSIRRFTDSQGSRRISPDSIA